MIDDTRQKKHKILGDIKAMNGSLSTIISCLDYMSSEEVMEMLVDAEKRTIELEKEIGKVLERL